jgi:methylase of polypeptide subunit release factors
MKTLPRVVVADDRFTADEAYGLACQGTAILWRGDFQNARQLLLAMGRRADRALSKVSRGPPSATAPAAAELFHRIRQARSQRARTLAALLIPLDTDYHIPLPRAPDVRAACVEAYGPASGASEVALRALLGVIGAHEWRVQGIPIAALNARIHPHYGVFAPIRQEYVDLVANAPLPQLTTACSTAFDIGTGTGVLAAVLAARGIEAVIATDRDPRAVACARENLARLGFSHRVEVAETDLFPPGRAALVVCNPPWIPARASSGIEQGVYDPESGMLRGFLHGLRAHLEAAGEGWLILSDLAERLGLRARSELTEAFDRAGLEVLGRLDTRPTHPKASDPTDPLHAARAAEVISLWRLAART